MLGEEEKAMKIPGRQKSKWKAIPNLPFFLGLSKVHLLYLSNHYGETRDRSLYILSKYT